MTFAAISFITIVFMSMLAYSTVFGQPGLENGIAFLEAEGEALKAGVGSWFGTLFWVIGALSLFAAAMGIVDYTSRLAADVLKTSVPAPGVGEPHLLRAGVGPDRDRHA